MKLSDNLMHLSKNYIYHTYLIYAHEDAKDYDKITAKKMIEYCIDYIQTNPEIICEICTEDELKALDLLFDKTVSYESDKNLSDLIDTFLVVSDLKTIEIPEELHDTIKQALKNVDWDKVKEKDKTNEILLGLMKAYGIILEQNLSLMCENLYQIHECNTPYLRRFIYYDYNQFDHLHYILLSLDYPDYYFEHQREYHSNQNYFDEDTLRVIAKYGADIRDPEIKKAYDALTKEGYRYHWETFLQCCHFNLELDKTNLHYFYKDDTMDILMKAIPHIPSAMLHGSTPLQYEQQLEDEAYVSKLNEKIIQRSTLPESEVNTFYKLYFGLLDYVNQKYHVIEGMKIYRQNFLIPEKVTKVRDTLFDHIDIIDEFIQVNPYNFNRRELDSVKDFKRGIRGEFLVLKFEKEFTVFVGDGKDVFYGVKSLRGNFNEIMEEHPLPIPVRAVLLPYSNRIIYDSLFAVIPLQFSARATLNALKGYHKEKVLLKLPNVS